jgi:hypothetical protein
VGYHPAPPECEECDCHERKKRGLAIRVSAPCRFKELTLRGTWHQPSCHSGRMVKPNAYTRAPPGESCRLSLRPASDGTSGARECTTVWLRPKPGGVELSRQNDNVRFQQSRNVLFHSVKLDGWKNRRC